MVVERHRRNHGAQPGAFRTLRRGAGRVQGSEPVALADIRIDPGRREVQVRGTSVRLTRKEFDLLWFFASNPNRVFSRDQLMARVWGYSAALDTGTVTVHVRRLREKLEEDASQPQLLETVWGVGYRLRA